MALAYRALYSNIHVLRNVTKPVRFNVDNYPITILSKQFSFRSNGPNLFVKQTCLRPGIITQYSIQSRKCDNQVPQEPPKKQGIVQRFKEMYKKYWYVVVPVHFFTSAIWFGSFYYIVRSGVDVIALFESLGVSESLLKPLRNSPTGYVALAFALYKLVTPLRYAVTLGGTTVAIKRLTAMGWIKPVPSTERLREMMKEKRDDFQERFKESKQHYQTQMKARRTRLLDEMKRYKDEMKSTKNKSQKKNIDQEDNTK